uniref:Uncharacterized protein n=1 Tax=Tetranychus urticae TaxID=32264 RepID=T1KKG4_TETUR
MAISGSMVNKWDQPLHLKARLLTTVRSKGRRLIQMATEKIDKEVKKVTTPEGFKIIVTQPTATRFGYLKMLLIEVEEDATNADDIDVDGKKEWKTKA